MFGQLAEHTAGTLTLEIQEIFATDTHGVVLACGTASRDGKRLDQNGIYPWTISGGTATELWGGFQHPVAAYAFG